MRMSMTVTMTPFSVWDKAEHEGLLRKRMGAVKNGITTTHWPHEYHTQSWAKDSDGKEIKQGAYVPP